MDSAVTAMDAVIEPTPSETKDLNLAVRFYSDNPDNAAGVPEIWPWQVVELGLDEAPPKEGTWVLMTQTEYSKYIYSNRAAYDNWALSYNTAKTSQDTRESQLVDNQNRGLAVIKQLGLYSLSADDAANETMFSEMQDVKAALELGMLTVASNLLNTKPKEETVLDAPYKDGLTFREFFSAQISGTA